MRLCWVVTAAYDPQESVAEQIEAPDSRSLDERLADSPFCCRAGNSLVVAPLTS